MRIIYIDSNGKEIITTLTADLLPFHTHDYEPKNENIQAHILNSAIHVTPEQTANFHAHSNKENLDAYNPSSFASVAHTHQWDRINFTVNGSALIDGIPSSQAGTGGTLRKYIGTYLAQKTEIIKNLNDLTEKSYNSLTDKPILTSLHSHSNKALLDSLINNGNGSQFLANDGTYKTVSNGNGSDVFPAGACYVHSTFNDVAPYYSTLNNAISNGYTIIQLGEGEHQLDSNLYGVHIQGMAGSKLLLGDIGIECSIIDVPIIEGIYGRTISFKDGVINIRCIELKNCNFIMGTSNKEVNIDTVIHSSNSYEITAGVVNINAHTAGFEYQTVSNPDKSHFIVGKNTRLYITNLKFAEFYIEPRDIGGNIRNAIFELEMASYLYLKNCRVNGVANNPIILSELTVFSDIHLLLDNCILIGTNSNEIVTTNNTNELYWNRNTIIKNGISGWQAINTACTVDATVDNWQ